MAKGKRAPGGTHGVSTRHPHLYTIHHSAGHIESITTRGRSVSASSYFPSQRPGQQSHYQAYANVDRGMAAKALRSARSKGTKISRQVGPTSSS
jgi:hypothetical protein